METAVKRHAAEVDVPAVAGNPAAAARPLLETRGISKRYGGTQALADLSLTVSPGHVQALVGANGAGKTTLIKILAGLERPDAGEIVLDGQEVEFHRPLDATKHGLSFLHQELHLVPSFTAAQNMGLGYQHSGRFGVLDRRAIRRRAHEVMQRLDPQLDLTVPVATLTVSQRWMVSLGRSLMRTASLIAMDEPTAAFTEQECERLFEIIRGLTAEGVAVLYISHRLDEVLEISDDVAVLRGSRLIGRWSRGTIDRRALTNEIVGREVDEVIHQPAAARRRQQPVLEIENLQRLPRVCDVTLDLGAGEILGLAGLVGAGRTELARLLFGADRPTAGKMTLRGRPYAPRSPFDAIRRGIALVPEERRSEGLLLAKSIAFNVSLATMEQSRGRFALLSPGRLGAAAHEVINRLGVQAASVGQPVGELSGGNQQKLVIGKYMRTAPSVLILDEPTVGVDVGARAEIYKIIRGLAASGTAVLVISSEFEELEICDRVAVMRAGRIAAYVTAPHVTKEHLTSLCYEAGKESDGQRGS
jgi:ribose transport system ATP-binding protein